MQNLEDADVVGEFSALNPFGQDYSFRFVDILKAGEILETEVQVIGPRSSDPPDAQVSLGQYPIIGKAVINTSLERHWEASIELMQANTNDRFLNMQIFAGLLRCIRKICIGRLIRHLTIVDIKDVSQSWYSDFFRLAGFRRCRCQSSAGSLLQLESWNCLALGEAVDNDFSIVYEIVRTWLAEGRCTRALLDSVTSREAAEVERTYFRDLLANLENDKYSQSTQARTGFTARDRTRSRRSWQEPMRKSAAPTRKVLEPRTDFRSLREYWPSQDADVKSMGGPAFRTSKKRKRGQNSQRKGLWRTRKV